MADCNKIPSKILKPVARDEFETLAKEHNSNHAFRTTSAWRRCVILTMAQMGSRNSLLDTVENSARAHRFYHLGGAKLFRSESCINKKVQTKLNA